MLEKRRFFDTGVKKIWKHTFCHAPLHSTNTGVFQVQLKVIDEISFMKMHLRLSCLSVSRYENLNSFSKRVSVAQFAKANLLKK